MIFEHVAWNMEEEGGSARDCPPSHRATRKNSSLNYIILHTICFYNIVYDIITDIVYYIIILYGIWYLQRL